MILYAIIIGIPLLILIVSVVSVIIRNNKSSKKIRIGRHKSCDIRVNDEYDDVSSNHGIIFMDGHNLIFEDDSTNGSSVNGDRVHHAQRIIRLNDKIILGKSYTVSWSDINRFFPSNDFLHTKITNTKTF
jgi:pSer/pThr/pTyr-binding forkhead associated (FHA) protein